MRRIIVDGFGGDNAPDQILLGAYKAAISPELQGAAKVIVTGDTEKLKAKCEELGIDADKLEFVHADEVITMEDDPTAAVRKKKNSSLVVAMRMLSAGEGDAVVSAGSTGAVLTAATLVVGRIKGIKRPALAPVAPTLNGKTMLLDCGANAECKTEYLEQFAIMGSVYVEKMFGVENPIVKLLNIGAEEHKGTELQKETYQKLKESSVNFCGNMEPNEFMFGACDVVVTDGFSGNILLKSTEGTAKALLAKLKVIFKSSIITKLAAMLIMGKFKELKKSMDASEIGGVPLLGISKPVIKAHGNSKAHAIYNAILQAIKYDESGIVNSIADTFSK